jgi:2-hydroxychromene-2-carboxylate isomerase
MPAPIDFYFDFSSPYGYLAGEKIDALAAKHGRSVNWRPMLLGAAFTALLHLTGVGSDELFGGHDCNQTVPRGLRVLRCLR